jgi:tRNA A37 threonylcarbamoyladenosine synthetase subunit TsaC/SUA5/YrdC
VYLDGGRAGADYAELSPEGSESSLVASTIVDATGLLMPEGKLRIVRSGVIPDAAIREIVGARCE